MLSILGGKWKSRLLKTPNLIRPTASIVRKAVFDICREEVEGAHFLDLYAGSGAMGIEALSRGAKEATFVEKAQSAIACIRHNLKELTIPPEQTTLFPFDAEKAVRILSKKGALFDFIYVDPPYALETSRILKNLLESCLLSINGKLLLEQRRSSTLDPDLLNKLSLLSERRFGDTALLIFRGL